MVVARKEAPPSGGTWRHGVAPSTVLTFAALFDLLSTIFAEPAGEIAPRVAALLDDPALAHQPFDTLAPLLCRLAEADGGDPAVEYARLFLHGRPFTAHPYESFYRSGLLMDAATLAELDALLAAGGVERSEEGVLPPDHLSVELEYLALLLRGLAGAEPRSSSSRAVRTIAQELLDRHLLPFSKAFHARLGGLHPAPRFEAAADILERALGLARALIGGRGFATVAG